MEKLALVFELITHAQMKMDAHINLDTCWNQIIRLNHQRGKSLYVTLVQCGCFKFLKLQLKMPVLFNVREAVVRVHSCLSLPLVCSLLLLCAINDPFSLYLFISCLLSLMHHAHAFIIRNIRCSTFSLHFCDHWWYLKKQTKLCRLTRVATVTQPSCQLEVTDSRFLCKVRTSCFEQGSYR